MPGSGTVLVIVARGFPEFSPLMAVVLALAGLSVRWLQKVQMHNIKSAVNITDLAAGICNDKAKNYMYAKWKLLLKITACRHQKIVHYKPNYTVRVT